MMFGYNTIINSMKYLIISISLLLPLNILSQGNYTTHKAKVFYDMRLTPYPLQGSGSMDQYDMEKLDSVLLMVQYKSRYHETTDDPFQECMEALYIGNRMSEYRENILHYSSIHYPEELRGKSHNPFSTVIDEDAKKRIAYDKEMKRFKPTKYTIQKNYPETGQQRCYYFLQFENFVVNLPRVQPNIYYDEDIPQFDWKLEEGNTIICGYVCQHASASFRGRTWKVWYAPDLPYQDGPWKLQGLPGLIMRAEDTEGDFYFEAKEIIKPPTFYIVIHPTYALYTKGSLKRVLELTELRYKNPKALVSLMLEERMIISIEDRGEKINIPQQSRTPCMIEKYE